MYTYIYMYKYIYMFYAQVMTVAPMYFRYDGVTSTGKWKEFQAICVFSVFVCMCLCVCVFVCVCIMYINIHM
jgi:hypothetical protein